MGEPIDLEVRRGGKKEPCLYCGQPEHPTPLACPRIEAIYINSEGGIDGIEFRESWDPPKLAG